MIIPQPGTPVLGIDIGKVITADTDQGKSFTDKYLEAPQMEGAFQSIWELYPRFRGQLYLISKCGGRMQVKTRHWLFHKRFHGFTNVPMDHVFFCEERRGKATICDALHVTHMVDDRLEVLGCLESVSNRYLFRPSEREIARHREHLSGVIRVESWKELMLLLRKETN